MIDISHKAVTKRTAVARGKVVMSASAFKSFLKEESPKGNVLEAAKIAGILAAKQTPQLIPHCHPLLLNKVNLSFDVDHHKFTVVVQSEVICAGQTGVEMEALCAVTVACLTIYDMMKWSDKTIAITDIRLLKKTGGKSGDFERKE